MPNKNKNKGSKRAKPVKPKVLANNQDLRPVKANKVKHPKQKGVVKPHHVHAVCSITDPFCPAAKNSKWPDGTQGNTLTEQFRGNYTTAGTTSGTNLFCFSPGAPFGFITTSAQAASTCTTTNSFVTYKANSLYATYGDLFRIVSFGVITRCVASATNASGIVTFGTGRPLAGSTVYNLGTELYDEVAVKAIQPGMEFSWISVPRGTGARDFGGASTASGVNLADWTSLIVEIVGPTSGNTLNFEWFVNIEFMANAGNTAITAIAKSNPPTSVSATTSVSKVHSSIGSFIEGGVHVVEQKIADTAKEALDSLMSDPLESIASLFSMF